MSRGWVAGLAAAGLVCAARLTVSPVESDENPAREGLQTPAADSAGPGAGTNGGGSLVMRSLDDAIEFAQVRRAALQHVDDYTATFSKTESIDQRLVSQTMNLKFRQKPFSVYMHCHSRRQPDREVIFIAGKNDDKLMVHESGLRAFVTMSFKPDDSRVMAECRHPITEIGMAKMLDATLAIWEREKDISPTNVEVTFSSPVRLGTTDCEEIRIMHEKPLVGLKFHITRLSFDRKTGFPVRVEQYDWPKQAGEKPPLAEQYTYSDIKPNAGLTDLDFDRGNSEYRFGGATLP